MTFKTPKAYEKRYLIKNTNVMNNNYIIQFDLKFLVV